MNNMEPKEQLAAYLKGGPVEKLVLDLAKKSRVSRATVYNILAGKDHRRSTWDKIKPNLDRRKGPKDRRGGLRDRRDAMEA